MTLSASELHALADSRPERERFGPDSAQPFLAFDLGGADVGMADWLRGLPCPVIGIGEGPLAKACDVVLATPEALPKLARNITATPLAAMVLVQHLRASESLSVEDALTAESFAYGTLQAGPEFARWADGHDGPSALPSVARPLCVDVGARVSLTLNAPETRNAVGVQMRDALCEALDMALALGLPVRLTGAGATFSTGGAVEEFGQVSDPATAHWVRSLRLPAGRLARLTDLHVHVNGAAIGAGAEMAAFGTSVTASPDAWFQLPELKYGLIPGAGGTASLPRRIGRQRTAYLALSMDRLRAEHALDWGLIDAIDDCSDH